MNKYTKILSIFLIGTFLSCTEKKEDSIIVFAATSLHKVLQEVSVSYGKTHSTKVNLHFASSGTLARQIEQGLEPDLYISANPYWLSYIDSLGFIQKGLKSKIARNELVLVTHVNHTNTHKEDTPVDHLLLDTERLSLGNPSHVPAGKYAMQVLNYYGINEQLKTKLIPTKDVLSALKLVALEEVTFGFVYKTDALKSEKVRIVTEFSKESHDAIVYVAGVCADRKEAVDFFSYLNSDEVETIFKENGFKN